MFKIGLVRIWLERFVFSIRLFVGRRVRRTQNESKNYFGILFSTILEYYHAKNMRQQRGRPEINNKAYFSPCGPEGNETAEWDEL